MYYLYSFFLSIGSLLLIRVHINHRGGYKVRVRIAKVRSCEPSILKKEIKMVLYTYSNDKIHRKPPDYLEITFWNFDFGESGY